MHAAPAVAASAPGATRVETSVPEFRPEPRLAPRAIPIGTPDFPRMRESERRLRAAGLTSGSEGCGGAGGGAQLVPVVL
eukprot:6342673-Alexandrium_andersonii.AAC.1